MGRASDELAARLCAFYEGAGVEFTDGGQPGVRMRNPTNQRKPSEITTREKRLAQFTTAGEPPPNIDFELLCQDHVGTYSLHFPCRHDEKGWQNAETNEVLRVKVLGRRPWDWTESVA